MSSAFIRGTLRGVDLDCVDNTDLTEDDYDDVRKAVLDVAYRWTHISTAFGIKPSKRKTITDRDVQVCLGEVVSLWLERDYNVDRFGKPNWRWVVKAIAEESGGSNPALAEKIALQHPMPSARNGLFQGHHAASTATRSLLPHLSTDFHETTSQEVSSPHRAPMTLPGAMAGAKRPTLDWFPDDGVRIATDGANMVFTRYEPYHLADTNNRESMKLSSGEVLIDRQQGIKQNPYAMDADVHGIAVIINNEQFETQPEREGSRLDEYNLVETFRYLRYKVEVYRECTSDDMDRIFQAIALRDHSGSDSFVCCILSHGKEGVVYGCDSKSVQLDNLTKRLNARRCRSLAGKPKLFFIQACRGKMKDSGVRIACDGGMLEVPNEADFLFSFATPSGQACFRDLDHGSWYISELCQVLCRCATYLHLNDMLTEMHGRVGGYEVEGHRQAPEITQRLQCNVYFF